MKKLILLTLLALLVSAHKAKAWCVLCYHPVHGALEQLMDEEKHHIVMQGTATMYEHNRKLTSDIESSVLTLTKGTAHHFKLTITSDDDQSESPMHLDRYIDGIRIYKGTWDKAMDNSEECE